MPFLITKHSEMLAQGWEQPDVVLVSGDAYVDHPSFGIAVMGRWLERAGYKVVLIAQPRYHNYDAFMEFGEPRLFFGVSAGNMDSIVSNYTGNAKVRDKDVFSPEGNPYFSEEKSKENRRRPDRASIRYSNLIRQAYPSAKIVLGGLEASLRRMVHYDYQQRKLRTSVLCDAKADILVHGMGERAILEIAMRLENREDLRGILGTCIRLSPKEISGEQQANLQLPSSGDLEILPSWTDIQTNPELFMQMEKQVDRQAKAIDQTSLLQEQSGQWVLQYPQALALSPDELTDVYGLPYMRAPHPDAGDVPAYRMIRHSVTTTRGCSGNCSFCAITRHQGPLVTSRTEASIMQEIEAITKTPDFKGTISDVGGPTANLYGTECTFTGVCERHDCINPKICKHLKIDEDAMLSLLSKIENHPKVKHLHISSGIRMELMLETPRLLEKIVKDHLPGVMNIAPEHTDPEVLRLMHKQTSKLLPLYVEKCREISTKLNKPIYFNPYFITGHPGSSLESTQHMVDSLKSMQIDVSHTQDFTPTPGTLSTAMYVSGIDRDRGRPVYTPKSDSERRAQRDLMEKNVSIRSKLRNQNYSNM
jgi:uncharacterized radical SAM protein YgiQ